MLYYVSGLKSSKALAAEFRLRLTLNVHRIVVPKWIWVHHWQQHCCTTPEIPGGVSHMYRPFEVSIN